MGLRPSFPSVLKEFSLRMNFTGGSFFKVLYTPLIQDTYNPSSDYSDDLVIVGVLNLIIYFVDYVCKCIHMYFNNSSHFITNLRFPFSFHSELSYFFYDFYKKL